MRLENLIRLDIFFESITPTRTLIYRGDSLTNPIITVETQLAPGDAVPTAITAQITFNGVEGTRYIYTSRRTANQTGFHATTAVKARRPCSRICSSFPDRQTSGQKCVLQRTTSIQVHVDAVATVVIYSLETIMSPPVQRVFREVLPYENRKQDLTRMALVL
jgi:hypothetical protein